MSRSRLVWLVSGLLLVSGCAQEIIAHQQEERDANHIFFLLREVGLAPKKVQNADSRELRFDVLVPQGEFFRALAVLEAHNLPKTARADTEAMFSEGGMIPTTEQERAKRVVGVEGDIVNALRDLPGVLDVQTAVSIPEVDPLRDINEEVPKPKASVIIVYRPDETDAPPVTPEDVQKFVQAKLPELRSGEVSVLLMPRDDLGGGGAGNGAAGAPVIDPSVGCTQKERVLSIEVCRGNRYKIIQLVLSAGIVAALLAALSAVAVLRAMRYRRDLTRLTAQLEQHGSKR